MLVLGLESSCDEMACAVVRGGKEILSNVVYSQIELHRPFGGVYPELACRRHVETLIPVVKRALDEARVTPEEIDLVAATQGPGLIGALLIGLNGGKSLAYAWGVPFVGVNHVEAHLYAAMMGLGFIEWPALGVVLSGGHTFLVKIHALGEYEQLGTTQDDALGEAFDKVATLLGLPYPGGPQIEALAKKGDPKRFPFRSGQVKGRPLDFSFSGLKTNVLYTVRGQEWSEQDKADIAASFQEAALRDIVDKTRLAAHAHGCKNVFCGGGVSNNWRLRALFASDDSFTVHYPQKGLSLDNAAMIAGLGFHLHPAVEPHLSLEPFTRSAQFGKKRAVV